MITMDADTAIAKSIKPKPEVGQRFRAYMLDKQFIVKVLRVETTHVLVEFDSEDRRWWEIGWFTIPGLMRKES